MARNKYPGECYRCLGWVEKGAGHFEKTKDGWRVQHVDCAIKGRQEKEKSPLPTPKGA